MTDPPEDRHERAGEAWLGDARLAAFMENLPGVAVIKDAQGRYVYVNHVGEEALRLSPGSWRGRTARELLPSELAERMDEVNRAVLATGEPVTITEDLVSPEGSRQWLIHEFPIPGESGAPTLLGAVCLDVTGQREMEASLCGRNDQLLALNSIARAINSTFDLSEIFGKIQHHVVELLGLAHPPLFGLGDDRNPTGEVVVPAASPQILGWARRLLGASSDRFPSSSETLSPDALAALRAGQPHLTSDAAHFLGPAVAPWLARTAQRALGVRLIATFPLMARGHLLGGMAVLSQKEKLAEGDEELLSSIADQAAIAIENAQLYEREHEERQLAEALAGISRLVSSTLNLDEVLALILAEVEKLLPCDGSSITLLRDGELRFLAARGLDGRADDLVGIAIPFSEAGFRMESDLELYVIPDVRADPRWIEKPVVEGVRAYMNAPLVFRGGLVGELQVYSFHQGVYTSRHAEILARLAGQTTVAIENARLYETAQEEIARRTRVEAALHEHSVQLEEMVRERTKELRDAQDELIRQEKLALLGQLAGGVGHDLRNPLATISNAAFFLKSTLTDADPTTGEYLDMISGEVRHAETIISELLDFSRVGPAHRERTSIARLVEDALARSPAPEGVEAVVDIPAGLPTVRVDAHQMGRVMDNLLSNAYQAMPQGGRLTIRAVGDGEATLISVIDTGLGISGENMKRLFEPLFTTRKSGTGLGLATVRRLAEANGGSVRVESEEGVGSAFTLTLPSDD